MMATCHPASFDASSQPKDPFGFILKNKIITQALFTVSPPQDKAAHFTLAYSITTITNKIQDFPTESNVMHALFI